jgi:hypothetical protein
MTWNPLVNLGNHLETLRKRVSLNLGSPISEYQMLDPALMARSCVDTSPKTPIMDPALIFCASPKAPVMDPALIFCASPKALVLDPALPASYRSPAKSHTIKLPAIDPALMAYVKSPVMDPALTAWFKP